MTYNCKSNVEDDGIDRMIYLNESEISFRCSCGANVFRKIIDSCRFRCNGCSATYTGESMPKGNKK